MVHGICGFVHYIGMYLSHLIFIEEGNKDFIQGKPGMINFNKRQVKMLFFSSVCIKLMIASTED